jgi:hypothetical protein
MPPRNLTIFSPRMIATEAQRARENLFKAHVACKQKALCPAKSKEKLHE